MPDDPLNILRVLAMLVLIAAFLGVLLSLVWPGAKQRSQEAAMIPLRDDGGGTPGGPA